MSAAPVSTPTAVAVVAARELRDLWLRGRGLPILLAYALLLSITSYVTATNRELNFLEQREALNQTLQIAVALGALLVLVAGAEAITGERDHDTIETLLLAPVHRSAVLAGKAVAVMSLWLAAYVCAVPYVLYLAQGTRVTMAALVGGFVVGSLLAIFAAGVGLALSVLLSTTRASMSLALFLLLALFAPTQLPASARQAWFGDALLHINPFTAGLRYLSRLVIDAHGATEDLGWAIGPIIAAITAVAVAALLADRVSFDGGIDR